MCLPVMNVFRNLAFALFSSKHKAKKNVTEEEMVSLKSVVFGFIQEVTEIPLEYMTTTHKAPKKNQVPI